MSKPDEHMKWLFDQIKAHERLNDVIELDRQIEELRVSIKSLTKSRSIAIADAAGLGLGAAKIAKRLGISRQHVYQLVKTGDLLRPN